MQLLPYTPYSYFLTKHFSCKIQKLPVDIGATCPVRDGIISYGGCAFCNGRSFVLDLCDPEHGVTSQLEKGKRFYFRKYSSHAEVKFLAYFQAGSNTYAAPEDFAPYFEEALSCSGVAGLVIATRPDCLNDVWLAYLQHLSERCFIMVELGVESVSDEVLERMGRGHGVECSRQAILSLASLHIPVGVHMILGLPGESRDSMLAQTDFLNGLPVDVLKLHQLQILKGARLERQYRQSAESFNLFSPEKYVEFVADYLELLKKDIAVERFVSQSPAGTLVAPRWGLKNDAVTKTLVDEFHRRTSWQGKNTLL